MSKDGDVFLFAAVYDDEADAKLDYDVVKQLHDDDVIGIYDAAIITRDVHGKVHVTKHEKPTQQGAWGGIAVGAVVGLLFPPSVLASSVLGGAVGGLIGHVRGGMSREDLRDLGKMLWEGYAGLLVVGEDTPDEHLDRAFAHAQQRLEKALKVDREDFERALAEAAKSDRR